MKYFVYRSKKRNNANSPQDPKDQKGASQDIFLVGEKKSRKQNPCQRKDAFGSY